MNDTSTPTPAPFSGYAILEQMGHIRTGGYVTEESHFGVALGRIDVPQEDGTVLTSYFGGASIFRLTPCDETLAREAAKRSTGDPIQPWTLDRLLPRASDADSSPYYGRADEQPADAPEGVYPVDDDGDTYEVDDDPARDDEDDEDDAPRRVSLLDESPF